MWQLRTGYLLPEEGRFRMRIGQVRQPRQSQDENAPLKVCRWAAPVA